METGLEFRVLAIDGMDYDGSSMLSFLVATPALKLARQISVVSRLLPDEGASESKSWS
jgi:hypothetical protein